jgi:hypothetical protein
MTLKNRCGRDPFFHLLLNFYINTVYQAILACHMRFSVEFILLISLLCSEKWQVKGFIKQFFNYEIQGLDVEVRHVADRRREVEGGETDLPFDGDRRSEERDCRLPRDGSTQRTGGGRVH